MAEIVFGLGTSHGPLLSTPPEQWHLRAEADRRNPAHPFRGGTYSFDELVALRRDEDLAGQLRPEVLRERHARCQTALATLAARLAAASPDIVVLIGNDQREAFLDDLTPAFTVFHGETVTNTALDEARAAAMAPGIAVSMWANKPAETTAYPCLPDFGRHIISTLIEAAFDVTACTALPPGRDGSHGLPHAYGFIYRRILNDRPIPAVPIIINTFYPPNQPAAGRCHDFGRAIAAAIDSWDDDRRVAVIASGGLSHFVVDEAFDRRMLAAMAGRDAAAFAAEPAHSFRSGTSETKNWITTLGALSATGLEMDLLDYVPCYRSEAGTGNAMAFATWG
jgi:Catalytic LigB subunit of aromatic ring-opening dioxygenase